MAAIVWLVAGILLAAAEMLTGDLTLLMLGSAAVITAGVSGLADTSLVVDAVVFGVTAIALLLLVRPLLLRRYSIPPSTPTGVDALPGKTARVLEAIDEHGGRVKLDGEVWSARAFDPDERYPEGSTVYIMRIDGAHVVVWKGP
ncbi:NfeD family protein [Nocardia sp. NBC_01503]|uniref:NfeD family protein n=1 Tax=Nocardia sp. NBC_01503 TaxID=2975997 RepID=UPI002E7B6BE4|nr:NfeD family protein [Nocardia sp. NBC_01503]WTL31024.1 NfeD family protein [Nocardia sp. NBC_01503]